MQQLTTGQRLPNFLRPDRTGTSINFYQACCARSLVLVTLDGAGQLPDLAPLADPDWLLVVLVRTPPENLPAADACPPDALVLADDGQVLKFLSSDPAPAVLLLDRQFRLLSRQPLAAFAREPAREMLAGAVAHAQAPVLVVPRILDQLLIDRLLDAYQQRSEPSGVLRMEQGQAVYEEAPDVKIRREHRLTGGDTLWRDVEARLRLCLLPEISWTYNYQVTRFEGVKVVAYDAAAGGYFSPHRDNDGEDTAHRRFAMTMNLNADDYDGGELCFPEYGQCYKPASGSAIIFACNLAHEARPVTRGVRYALVSFFFSEAEQMTVVPHERRV
ncbi:MAG: 2OG-Fe(II) oxygenase [Pseudomonadota bacterium]